MSSREFTTVECHRNESSFGKIGYVETVTTNREIVANHLAYTHLYMFLVAEQVIKPKELEDVDTEESMVLEHKDYAESIKASRDTIKIHKKSMAHGVELVFS